MKIVGIPSDLEEGDASECGQRMWTTGEMNAVKHTMGLI